MLHEIYRHNIEILATRAYIRKMSFQDFTEHLMNWENGSFLLTGFAPVDGLRYKAVYTDSHGNQVDAIFWTNEDEKLVFRCAEIFEADPQ